MPTPPAVAPLHPGLTLGPLHVATPVVLAPMAGITDAAYRRLCREQGAGLYVCEMVTSRGLVERDPGTLESVSYRPSQEFNPITWSGDITPPKPAPKKKSKKKG